MNSSRQAGVLASPYISFERPPLAIETPVIPYQNATIVFEQNKHRLFDPVKNIIILMTAISDSVHARENQIVHHGPNWSVSLHSRKAINRTIQFALGTVLEDALKERPMNPITINVFESKPGILDEPKGSFGFQRVLLSPFLSEFVLFYEKIKSWHDDNSQDDPSKWNPIFDFGRVIRNAISHDGHHSFRGKKARPVSWHNFQYSPVDDGKPCIGTDFWCAELFVLMLEMNDELDKAGAPIW